MTENTIPFDELMQQVLDQLKNQGYKDSTLADYRRLYNRVISNACEINPESSSESSRQPACSI